VAKTNSPANVRTSAPSSEIPQFVGRIRAAQLLDCSPQTIDKFIRTGKLRGFRIGRKVVVRQDELLRLAEGSPL
jgi:excisionase family DNA binding protein